MPFMPSMSVMNAILSSLQEQMARASLSGATSHFPVPTLKKINHSPKLKLSALKQSGHWPTLLTAFLYFDFSFMVWTVLGPLGAQIGEALHLNDQQKGFMVAVPILSGAILRILLGLLVDRIGAKNTGIIGQIIVIIGLALAWILGLPNYEATIL